jgi:TfoX/Sxy family transcriptional regulator of competence genes
MAYNEDLGERLREKLLSDKNIAEKRMFGGVSFLLNGKMTCGVLQDNLVVKVDPPAAP